MTVRLASLKRHRVRILWSGLTLLWAAPWLALWVASQLVTPPSFRGIHDGWTPSEAWLLDRHGQLLSSQRRDLTIRRLEWTRLQDISPALIKAILLAEDRRFHEHGALDLQAVLGAISAWARGGQLRGASTITMQLATLLEQKQPGSPPARSIRKKFRQISVALALERQWEKSEILEAYLNLVSFRGELQGIAATARALFDKHPSGLSESESIILSALLPAPNADRQRLSRRACAIAEAGGFATPCATLQTLTGEVLKQPTGERLTEAHWAPTLARRFLQHPGERVTTTLDLRWQQSAEDAVQQQLAGLGGRNVRDGAAVILDNATGEVLAYVASAGSQSTSAQVDGIIARRQAGSTLKPFLYGMALEQQFITAASVLDDSPVNLETSNGLYIPQNYDHDFKGPVSVRTALASSLNVPAVRTLILVGVERFRDRLEELGYRGLTEDGEYYGFSLALGSAEVSLLEQVNAYRALANGGIWSPMRFLPDSAPNGDETRRVMSAEATYLITDILSDNAGRSVTFGLDSPLATRFWSAVKTGTSKDMRDNWCIGFSRRYTVGVWVGNFEGDSMQDVSGISGAAPAWAAIMSQLHAEQPGSAPEPPEGIVRQAIRFEPAIEPPRDEWFMEGTETALIQAAPENSHQMSLESPPDGIIIALDPDIPPANQKIQFRAKGGEQAIFMLDEEPMGPASTPYPWRPSPGPHVLKLRREVDGFVVDTIRFQVRAPR